MTGHYGVAVMAARNKRNRRRPAAPRTPAAPVAHAPETASEAPIDAPALPQLRRSDVVEACGVTVAAGALFLTTFSTHVALGDAPESVAGAKTLGVLHAPGYPSYVAVAHVFASIFAIGGWAARVNAFSGVCAAVTVGAVYLLARAFGASRAGSVLGALALASSASFWFNADFAKHYSFSGLLVTLAALAVVQWQSGGRSAGLVVAGVLLGVGAGASWELVAIMAVGLVGLVAFGPRRPGVAVAAVAASALVIVAVGAYGFLMWRAGTHPAVSWGEVTDFHRLVGQVTQRDFRGQDVNVTQHSLPAKVAIRMPTYVGILERDIGLGAFVLALFGAVLGTRGLDRGRKVFLAAVAALNLASVVFVAGIDRISGFLTGIVAGGYILDLLVVVAVLAALGTTALVDRAAEYAGRSNAGRRRGSNAGDVGDNFRFWFTAGLVVVVLVPSIAFHYRQADHRQPPFADRYAARVLGELPPHAALFVYQADLTFPLVYRQAVFGDRPDVSLIVTTSLQFEWYRAQIARTLHLREPVGAGATQSQVRSLINEISATRPVFIDIGMMTIYRSGFPFRLRGLVGEVVGRGVDVSIDRDALATELIRADRADEISGQAGNQFPNGFVFYLYSRAHVELAKQYAQANQLEAARTELARSVDDFPDSTIRLVLRYSAQSDTKPADAVRVIEAL